MRPRLPKILVTGGAGFIGSVFTRLLLKKGYKVIVVDKITYAGDLRRLKEVKDRYKFYKTDICNKDLIGAILKKEEPLCLVNFAASTHVDRSILNSAPFIETNIKGTQSLLDLARKYKISRFVHISTDEIYGEIDKGRFSEDSPLKPNSPYAASKAASDLFIKSYVRTYKFPAIIIRPCNNYGPWQYPEKLIPLAILKLLRGEKIPVYADGRNVREWLYVDDCAMGILEILKKGRLGEVYNLGSGVEKQNIEVVQTILDYLGTSKKMIKFVKDRPGHDLRYSLNSKKVFDETKWIPKVKFVDGIKQTIDWCMKHKRWLLNKWKDVAKLYR